MSNQQTEIKEKIESPNFQTPEESPQTEPVSEVTAVKPGGQKEAELQKERTEQISETEVRDVEEQKMERNVVGVSISSSQQAQPVVQSDPEVKEVENILAEDLADFYTKMDPVTQQQFKAQGEDTARTVNLLLSKAKVKIKEVVGHIVKWLKMIPGVNKFFIEQQAKIKADKLMALKRKREEER